ncbi:hypothetical protein [Caballeronia novacaledonica]|uniref:hypothetical protein n=1 Tax=Caballeronia novacaledonica TaxID=1544861 RepID=UPI001FE8364C|nr:hypothetical protein [Caballeronia novacaledonica]
MRLRFVFVALCAAKLSDTWHTIRSTPIRPEVRNTVCRTSVHIHPAFIFSLIVHTGRAITLFPDIHFPGIVTLGYVVTMARDSSYRRDETVDAQQNRDEADESGDARRHASRPTGTGVSVMLWDEIAPASAHAPPLDDESPET